ncbi:MAG TPA: hypothetical protein VK530_21140 [Candidatus Acidoferrum sp.]|nr:hypothetical protein [Candidatus Acidoferrum sp.]
MTTFEIEIIRDTARPAARALAERARNPLPGLNIAARALANGLKSHFRAKNQTPNRLGGARSNYWLGVAQAVNAPQQTGPNSVAVAISHPSFNQKVYGGTIRAKAAKSLTIPIHPDAHGRRASVLERALGLKLFRVKDALAARGADGKLTFYYALKQSVTQKPDPSALPPESEMQRIVSENFNRWFMGPQSGAQPA